MRKEDFKILYDKFLLGNCTEEELQALKIYFSQLEDIEELENVETLLKKDKNPITLDSNRSKIILDNIIQAQHKKNAVKIFYPYFKYVAAACILIIGFILIRQKQVDYSPVGTVFTNNSPQIKKVLLQDGTSIYIKPNSQLIQSTNFDTDSVRTIHIKGEAFFAIAHNAEKPFIVKTDNQFEVRVLGTRFNLKSTPDEQEVILTQGSVALSNDKSHIVLTPAERAVYSKELQMFETSIVDTLRYVSWIDNQLYFLDTELQQVIEQLNKNYVYETQKLSIPQQARHLQFTGYLPIDNLDKCITILNKTFANHHITVTKE